MNLRRVFLTLAGIMMLGPFLGCGSSFGRTGDERAHMYKSITRSEWRMVKDDIDNFLLMDRRTRLTRWH